VQHNEIRQTNWQPTEAPPLYSQDGKGYEATVHAHYFLGASDWLLTEYDPEEDLAFGWVCLNGDRQLAELGYWSMAELRQVTMQVQVTFNGGPGGSFRQPVEREHPWRPVTIREAINQLDRDSGRTA